MADSTGASVSGSKSLLFDSNCAALRQSVTEQLKRSYLLRTGTQNSTCHQCLEKEMATHPGILAWRIPGTEEPSRLPSVGSHRVGHD